ncbi:hypothetical protein [Candidatus Entotheonella palauensis]|nr:hypothetical protein [Candidatus Entotheonella palauensis]
MIDIVENGETKPQSVHAQQVETRFWSAYQKLAKLIQPVSISSIKATNETVREQEKEEGHKISRAMAAVRRYQRLSVVALVSLLVVQFYFLFGQTIITGVDENEKKFRENAVEEVGLKSDLEAIEADLANGQGDRRNEKTQIVRKLADLEAQQEQLTIEIEAKYELLRFWDLYKFLYKVFGLLESQPTHVARAGVASAQTASPDNPVDTSSTTDQTSPGNEEDNPLQTLLQEGSGEGLSEIKPNPQADLLTASDNLSSDAGSTVDIRERYRMLQAGRFTLEALSSFVLPLLYGLLGACAYVLRTLTVEIRTYTYRHQSDVRFRLRLYLGVLAGFAVAWFVNTDTAPTLAESITPLALAFLAGYSVELVFAAMDALIDTFSNERSHAQSS